MFFRTWASTFWCLVVFEIDVRAVYKENPFLQGGYLNSTTTSPVSSTTKAPSTAAPLTKPPVSTIKPPAIPNGEALNSKCLQPNGQFPSTSCNKYVNCWLGIAIEQTCPLGLVFNPKKLYCDYEENVDCQGKAIVLDPSTTVPVVLLAGQIDTVSAVVSSSAENSGVQAALRKFCQRSVGLFPGSTCSKFVNCWADNAVEQDCPQGLYFSPEGYCDYPQNVECSSQEEKTGPSNYETRKSECPLEFGTFRDRTTCDQYYTCAFDKIVAKYQCPEGFSFSDLLGVCDYSYRVDCSKEPQIFQKDTQPPFNAFAHPELLEPSEYGDSRCIVSQGLVRDKDNCSIYYSCNLGYVNATYVCPPGYAFSNELRNCDLEGKVNCHQLSSRVYDSAFSLSNIPKDVLSLVQNCSPGSVFRLNPQCTIACRCKGEIAEIIECSPGLAYDSQVDKCVSPYLARC